MCILPPIPVSDLKTFLQAYRDHNRFTCFVLSAGKSMPYKNIVTFSELTWTLYDLANVLAFHF